MVLLSRKRKLGIVSDTYLHVPFVELQLMNAQAGLSVLPLRHLTDMPQAERLRKFVWPSGLRYLSSVAETLSAAADVVAAAARVLLDKGGVNEETPSPPLLGVSTSAELEDERKAERAVAECLANMRGMPSSRTRLALSNAKTGMEPSLRAAPHTIVSGCGGVHYTNLTTYTDVLDLTNLLSNALIVPSGRKVIAQTKLRGNNNRFFYEVDCSKDSAMAIAISTVFKTLIGKHEGFKQLMKSVFADYKVKLFSTAHLICEVRYPPPPPPLAPASPPHPPPHTHMCSAVNIADVHERREDHRVSDATH